MSTGSDSADAVGPGTVGIAVLADLVVSPGLHGLIAEVVEGIVAGVDAQPDLRVSDTDRSRPCLDLGMLIRYLNWNLGNAATLLVATFLWNCLAELGALAVCFVSLRQIVRDSAEHLDVTVAVGWLGEPFRAETLM